jgi:hypothetical protein
MSASSCVDEAISGSVLWSTCVLQLVRLAHEAAAVLNSEAIVAACRPSWLIASARATGSL